MTKGLIVAGSVPPHEAVVEAIACDDVIEGPEYIVIRTDIFSVLID